ncbi:MAG: hypothetical protein IPL12_16120 [Bacteroidetes bacterium]|nr:hypothetical protein [Bacteroidota bacterium]
MRINMLNDQTDPHALNLSQMIMQKIQNAALSKTSGYMGEWVAEKATEYNKIDPAYGDCVDLKYVVLETAGN